MSASSDLTEEEKARIVAEFREKHRPRPEDLPKLQAWLDAKRNASTCPRCGEDWDDCYCETNEKDQGQ